MKEIEWQIFRLMAKTDNKVNDSESDSNDESIAGKNR